MTTHAPVQASPPPDIDTRLDFAARLALTDAIMAARLDRAGLAFDVNTAHIPSAEPLPEITEVVPLTPTAAPSAYTTPLAATLHRARKRIVQDGWCRDAAYDDQGAVCPIRAIRLEAATRHQADDACVLLLDVIQRDIREADTIPSWNAAQTSAAPVLLAFDRATDAAHNRGI